MCDGLVLFRAILQLLFLVLLLPELKYS